ncbi:MAG: multidrug ABC transporter [Lachnospiraceae bacterium]|nr:multidrug ABC transporter [Lachnospiraceae bacterium]
MNKLLLIYAAIMMFGTFISAVSQVILKKAAGKEYENKIREYLNAPVIIAYSIFIMATFLSVFAYKVVPLSMGPILEATSYIYITIFGVTIFKEKLSFRRVIALSLIIVGIVVYSVFGV